MKAVHLFTRWLPFPWVLHLQQKRVAALAAELLILYRSCQPRKVGVLVPSSSARGGLRNKLKFWV